MKKWLLRLGILLAVLVLAYYLGPKPFPDVDTSLTLPAVSETGAQLEKRVRDAEAAIPNIKPDNEARIIWFDSIARTRTPYAVVYIPGFTATYAEGEPIHREFAKRYGCNLYIPRLKRFGLDDVDAFAELTPEDMLQSAAEALAVGKQLGEKVILMSTSTGGTLAIALAAQHPEIDAVIAYSPNIAIFDERTKIVTGPWGKKIGRMVMGNDYNFIEGKSDEYKKYWYTQYRYEGIIALQALLDHTMTPETFAKVKQPFFLGYYYKNEEEQDKIVSVPAMLQMFRALGTPPELKREVAFPEVGHHVVGSYLTSKDLESVRQETYRFAEEILELKKVEISFPEPQAVE